MQDQALERPPVAMGQVTLAPVHRSILVVDVEGSTRPCRTNSVKRELRDQVYGLLWRATDASGIEPWHLDPPTDQGDGVLLLVHPVDEVPKTRLLHPFIPHLASGLARYNAGLPPAERTTRGLRLRLAVHAGEIHLDDNGYFGEPLDVAFRLLNAPRFKACSYRSASPLSVIVSEDVYWAVVRHDYEGIDPRTYAQLVSVEVGGRRRKGWVTTFVRDGVL